MCGYRQFIAHYYRDGHYLTRMVQLRLTKQFSYTKSSTGQVKY